MTDQSAADAITDAFDTYHQNLKLSKDEREAAIARWHEVRDALVAEGLVTETFLQGSFARKTMRKPLNDVDVVVILSDDLFDTVEQEADQSRENAPSLALSALERVLQACFAGASFEHKKHALGVSFDDRDFGIDLTPGREAADRGVVIANTETGDWDWSDCRLINDAVAARNKECDGRFVHQVRMAREVTAEMVGTESRLKMLRGLVAESILFNAITGPESHADAMVAFLEHAETAVLGQILTPSGREDITRKREWDQAQRQAASEAFGRLLALAREAVELTAAGDDAAALSNWASICGEHFPDTDGSVEEFLKNLRSGSATRSGAVTTAMTTGAPTVPQRAWRH